MKFISILLIIFSLYPTQHSFRPIKKSYLYSHLSKKGLSVENFHIYKAFITGNKKNIPKPLRRISKKYGFTHLFTPSGIHLSSILGVLKLSSWISTLFLFFASIYVFYLSSYPSMERILIFKFFYLFLKRFNIKDIELCFLGTVFFSLLISHYNSSPLSFIYSFSFWGTILIFRNSPIKLIFHLNFMLFFLSSFMAQEVSPLSIIVNPAITSLVSFVFPSVFLNSFLPEFLQFNSLFNFLIDQLVNILEFINDYDPFPTISISTEVLFFSYLLYLVFNKRISLLFLLVLYNPALKPQKELRYKSHLRPENEYVQKKRGWNYGEVNKCKIKQTDFFCKKKPSYKRKAYIKK